MAICDLSGQNPNVLFELGIRQAFNKPVTIIKDLATQRIFDIDGLRCIDYDEKLRVDNISIAINIIAETLKNTYGSEENSLIESLSITPAKTPTERVLSDDTSIILESIKDIKDQLNSVKNRLNRDRRSVVYFTPEINYDDARWGKFSEIESCTVKDEDETIPHESLKKYSDQDIMAFIINQKPQNKKGSNDNESTYHSI
ncbi:hypothetical protein MSSIH_1728 [Methanosarcina siciliae HI350]|uniref:Uncharacterized protein n=1 Tax=Methanosarcina siciliae HI350 TaxID=1434119 RepID=A0A0E3PD83_9EURY|nr:hypothetical protein [Methanosarcina siciliae]AKB32418.1 hypothetical protein MSSIH_1728 [Methanosarcina siciliae HI350]